MAIAVAVSAETLVLRTRDETVAWFKAFPISRCSTSSACSERKRGERSGRKSSFIAIGWIRPLLRSASTTLPARS